MSCMFDKTEKFINKQIFLQTYTEVHPWKEAILINEQANFIKPNKALMWIILHSIMKV